MLLATSFFNNLFLLPVSSAKASHVLSGEPSCNRILSDTYIFISFCAYFNIILSLSMKVSFEYILFYFIILFFKLITVQYSTHSCVLNSSGLLTAYRVFCCFNPASGFKPWQRFLSKSFYK